VSFVVDTDICSKYLKGDRRVFNLFMQHSGGLFISTVTLAELYSWAYRTVHSPQRLEAVANLLTEVIVLPVDPAVALRCGQVRAGMLDSGHVLAAPDLLIASTALLFDYTMVTHNTVHFAMVPGLRLEDWVE
jgi:tRNA(fMet)-specific endonuclease VapC